ncbi:hypothetical protein CAPTEDRAFT_222675 [Capitella teleta]|uniref:DnaJ homolog subfamily B member 9 n=1 Tax=Capitella teleta TaxID=283909 RepID=R7TW44_CAPTE|nr:hypothetical protein CAPTEDRAFT_222675 [Capitella teleta]|eukprot:ELT95676.1 hypothetical protein CAPTEDRAFT_222675 [Capitella teleta]
MSLHCSQCSQRVIIHGTNFYSCLKMRSSQLLLPWLLSCTLYYAIVEAEKESADFYKILQVKPTASEAEIKRAFRNLARKYHPDKNRDDPDAEEKFRDIAEAYEVLSDSDKRKKYDLHGASAFSGKKRTGHHFDFDDFFHDFDLHHDLHRRGQGHDDAFQSGRTFTLDDFFDDSMFDFGHESPQQKSRGRMNQHFQRHEEMMNKAKFQSHKIHTENIRSNHNKIHEKIHSSRNSAGQKCQTIVKHVGNMKTSQTICS